MTVINRHENAAAIEATQAWTKLDGNALAQLATPSASRRIGVPMKSLADLTVYVATPEEAQRLLDDDEAIIATRR
ncbi:hypothetical protein RF644_17730 [Kocuria sp. CPCC 205258]|uniref:hypothetical protein n=1 Tax=Kocuria sp. CPCC 205258 TaxID=3073552 RepID=UPI0034D47F27